MKKVTEIAVSRPAPKKTRAAAYCRVSTDSDAQLESLDTHKSHYEQYISAHDGWELAGIYYDEGISGTKTENRAELLPYLIINQSFQNNPHAIQNIFNYKLL